MAYDEIVTDRAGLRSSDTYSPEALGLRRQREIDNSTQFGRGWESAGLSEEGNAILDQANNAWRKGDVGLAQALEQQGRDRMAQAAQWAPTVKNLTDVRGLGQAMDWAGGALGNIRSSVAPAAGAAIGAGLGAAAGFLSPVPGGTAIGRTVGGYLGGALAGYDTEANEAVANAMLDPTIRANKSMQEIKDVGRVKGAINAGLESLVPATTVNLLAGAGGRVAKGTALKTIGKTAGLGAGGEFLTEGSQSLVGQGAENYLKDKPVNDFDYTQAFNEAAAGAVAGGGMGAVGGGGQVLASRLGDGADATRRVASDPVGTLANTITTAGGLAGKGAAKAESAIERIFSMERAPLEELLMPGGTPEQKHAAALKHAEEVMRRKDATQEERDEAVKLAMDGDWASYRDRQTIRQFDKLQANNDSAIADEIAQRTGAGTGAKFSLMQPTLTDDFGETEGRDMSGDRVVDSFGNLARNPEQSAGDIATQANAAIASEDMAPRGHDAGPLKNAVERRQLEDTADILRRQGVEEGLLKATSDMTDPHQRAMAIGLLGWVKRGFKDTDGNTFVPESLTNTYGAKAPQMIKKAIELAYHQKLIGIDTVKQRLEIEKLAQEQHANNTAVFDTVVGAMPESVRKLYGAEQVREFIPELRRIAEQGATKREDAFLTRLFGSKEGVAQAMSLFREPKGKANLIKSASDEDLEDGSGRRGIKLSDEQIENEGRFNDHINVADDAETQFAGYNRDNAPFDTENLEQAALLKKKIKNNPSNEDRRTVGVWARIKESFTGDERTEAENALLVEHGEHFLKPSVRADMEHYGVSMEETLEDMHPSMRWSILSRIDQRFRMIRMDVHNPSEAADTVKTLSSLEEGWDHRTSEHSTVQNGGLILERRRFDGTPASPFATSALKLMKHIWTAREREENDPNRPSGAQGVYQDMLAALAALMEKKGRKAEFTSRIGYKTEATGEIHWLNLEDGQHAAKVRMTKRGAKAGNNLPKNLQLGWNTVFDALEQAAAARQEGDGDYQRIAYAENYMQRRRALIEMGNSSTTPESLRKRIAYALKSKANTEAMYTKLRNQTDAVENDLIGNGLTNAERAQKADPEALAQARKNGETLPGNVANHVASGSRNSYDLEQRIKQQRRNQRGEQDATDKDIVPSEAIDNDTIVQGTSRAEDTQSTIHRDARGEMAGFNGNGVEGNARGGSPVATKDKLGQVKLPAEDRPGAEHRRAPLGTKSTPDRTALFSADAALHRQVLEARGDLGVRTTNRGERRQITQALEVLSQRGLGPALAQLGHIFIFTKGEHSGLFLGWNALDKGGIIGLNARTLSVRKSKLFPNIPTQVQYVLAHELGHNLDLGDDMRATRSSHPGFAMSDNGAVGALAKEMERAAQDERNPFYDLLTHTPFNDDYNGRPEKAQYELFAQAYAIYALLSADMREHLPLTFAHMEKLNEAQATGQRIRAAETVAGRSSGDESSLGRQERDVPQGDHAGTGEGTGLPGGVRRAVGDQRPAPGRAAGNTDTRAATGTEAGQREAGVAARDHGQRVSETGVGSRSGRSERVDDNGKLAEPVREQASDDVARQLAAYLQRATASGKNALLTGALRSAIDYHTRGVQTGSVQRALEAARKQLGALPTSGTQAQQGSTTTASDPAYRWARYPDGQTANYEVSTAGDKRFSALHATLSDGRTIEEAYQLDVKGYRAEGNNWRLGKSKPPLRKITKERLYQEYKALWAQWAQENPARFAELAEKAKGKVLTDKFASTEVSQARALSELLNERGSAAQAQQGSTTGASNDGAKFSMMSTQIHNDLGKQGFAATHPNYVIYDDSRIETNYVHFNAQSTTGKRASPDEVAAAEKHLLDTLGDGVEHEFRNTLFGASGKWTPGETKNVISLALDSDVLGTSYHESLHEFFSMLMKNGADNVTKVLSRVATQGPILRQMERLLKDHPEALKQLSDPEEAAAYMYQFWRAGLLKLGPQTEGVFQKIANALRKVFGMVSKEIRDQQHAEMILTAFTTGAVADSATRAAAVKLMQENTASHDRAMENIGKAATQFNAMRELVYTAEGMMEATGSKYARELAQLFNQKAGAAMKVGRTFRGTLFDAVPQVRARFLNKLKNILQSDGSIEKEDIELIREALATGKDSNIPRVQAAVMKMRALNDELMHYIDERDISRLNEKGEWVKVKKRKDFGMPQVWDTDLLMKDPQPFIQDLLNTHLPELEAIARQAEAEIVAANASSDNPKVKPGQAAQAAMDAGMTKVTPQMVAEAIAQRVIGSDGQVDIEETTSQLGVSPMAASVNRRSLSWIDNAVFDKYKEKDLIKVYTSYINNMVKRGEYVTRFGHGGERIHALTDAAFLESLGGDALVSAAQVLLPEKIKAWAKARHAAMENGQDFDLPRPTLRSVGGKLHTTRVGPEQAGKDVLKAAHDLAHMFRAVQAMEGTLGMGISPGLRNLNSMLITYQNVRLLSTSLITSFSDIMGLVVQGGKLSDAWDAFVRGIREVKMSAWDDTKSKDAASERAELWGSVDAASFSDAIGQSYGGNFLSGRAKAFSDSFFRKIGMEGWNRAMRISATMVGERIFKDWASGKLDLADPAVKARFERMYGEGASQQDIRLDANGELDVNDVVNQAAIMRFVNDAVIRPNAAIRTTWGSDPRFAALSQLKSYTYAFHKVMLEAAVSQGKLGNYRPALAMFLGYMPVIIAADAIKEMMIPGDEPPWMKMGMDGFLQHGWQRAGLLGVPQYLVGGLRDPASLLGPTVDELQNFGSIPFMETHSLLGEVLGALPGGNLLRRLANVLEV